MCNFIYKKKLTITSVFGAVRLCGTALLQRYVDAGLTVLLCFLVVRQGSLVQEIQTSHENIVKINAAGESECLSATSTFITDNFPFKNHLYTVVSDWEPAGRKRECTQ